MNNKLPERLRLIFAQVFIAIVLLILIFSGGTHDTWPFIHWHMYGGGTPKIPEQISRVELRALDGGGAWHVVQAMDLLSLDDVTSNQPDGGYWVGRAFEDRARTRARYFPALARRVETILGQEILVLEARDLKWKVNFNAYPPIDIDRPDEEIVDGRYDVLLYTEPNPSPDSELDLIFGDDLGLLASTFPIETTLAQCQTLLARTWWRALRPPEDDYHVTVVLADADGVGQVSQDRPLAQLATSQVEADAEWFDSYTLDIPCDLPPGDYRLLLALYSLDDRQNQPIFYADGAPYGEYAVLTSVTVVSAS